MSKDRFEFLSSCVDNNVVGYYTKISEFAALVPATGQGPPLNAFAVLCSRTMPKASKGSHKYSVTFSIVDPSITLATSVPFVWFCNNLNNLHMNFKVGDIIRIQGGFLQSFNSYPQLIGKDNCTSVTIFHRKDNFLTGWPSEPLTVVPPVESVENSENEESEDGRQARAAAAVRLPYLESAWEITNLGVAEANLGEKMSKKERKALPTPPVDRPPLMWPQEIHKLLYLYDWVDRYFTTHSFADSTQVATQHVTLHAMQMYLHRAANSQAYDALLPAAEPHPDGVYPAVPMQGGSSNKCDLVCLVMSVVPASASVDGLARMTVWDGTTNGMYAPSLQLGKAIQVALDAPAVYDSADELAFYQEANRRTEAAEATETNQTAHTQSSHLSTSSSAPVFTGMNARDDNTRRCAGCAVGLAAVMKKMLPLFLLLINVSCVSGFVNGYTISGWRNRGERPVKNRPYSANAMASTVNSEFSTANLNGRASSVVPTSGLKPAEWVKSVFGDMRPSMALINRTSCESTWAAGYDTQCIIDDPDITMANPLLGLNLTSLTQTVLDVAQTRPDSRMKPLLATVRGTGGGKTRLFEEIRRELQKNHSVLPLAITFNQNTLFENEEFKGVSASCSAALSIIARMASAFYDESFDAIMERMLTQPYEFGISPCVDALYVAFVQQMRDQMQAAGCPVKTFVLLIDETMKLLEGLERYYPNGSSDPLSKLRTALLNQMHNTALALSSLSVEVQGVTDSGRPLEALLQCDAFDPDEIVAKWWNIRDPAYRHRLRLIAAMFCDLPRALEIANTYIQDHRAEISAPKFCEDLMSNLRTELKNRYTTALFIDPSPQLLRAMFFMTSSEMDANAAEALRASVLTNVLDREIHQDATKWKMHFSPRVNLFMLTMAWSDWHSFFARLQALLNDILTSTLQGSFKSRDVLKKHTALMLNARVGVAMNCGATVSVAELLGLDSTDGALPWSLHTDIKLTEEMSWPVKIQALAHSSYKSKDGFLKEIEAIAVSPEQPIQMRLSARGDAFDVFIKVYDTNAPGKCRYYFLDNKSLKETKKNAKKKVRPQEFPTAHKSPYDGRQARQMCAVMAELAASTTYVYLTTRYVKQAVYNPPGQPLVAWVLAGREQVQDFMGPLWDLNRTLREGSIKTQRQRQL